MSVTLFIELESQKNPEAIKAGSISEAGFKIYYGAACPAQHGIGKRNKWHNATEQRCHAPTHNHCLTEVSKTLTVEMVLRRVLIPKQRIPIGSSSLTLCLR